MTDRQRSDEAAQNGKRKPRVLVADDEVYIAITLKAILNQEGFDVITASGGEEAIRKAEQWRPDLVLCDVFMPDMDGIAASIRIAGSLPACKVVLLSGHGVVHDLMKTVRTQGHEFDVLLKPIHPVDLIEHLRSVLRRG